MPSLNQAGFIDQAIDSVLHQAGCNIELIVADGGSTDGTVLKLADWRSRDSRLKWFSEVDKGPAHAVNKALAQVRGTIIGWLNSDDVYAASAVPRAVHAMAEHPEWMMLYGQAQHIDDQGEVLGYYPSLPPNTPIGQFTEGCFICQPSVFFRRTQYVLLGGLDETLKTAFDFDYWLRAFSAFPERIGFIDAVQAYSRLHSGCITQNQRRLVALEGMSIIKRYFGVAPAHWLWTYINEYRADGQNAQDASSAQAHITTTIKEARVFISESDYSRLLKVKIS